MMTMSIVECPECGREFYKKGFNRHKGSRICKIKSVIKKYKDDGYVEVKNSGLRNWLDEHNFTLIYDWVYANLFWRPWCYGDKYRKGYWSTEKEVELAKEAILPRYSILKKYEEYKYEKIWENERKILVGRDNNTYLFDKSEMGKTRKRKFLSDRKQRTLYSLNGRRFGTRNRVDYDEVIEKAESAVVAWWV